MYGNISDEKANEYIRIVSENVRRNLLGRSVVETPLFPVSHYIHVATYILYDQSYLYNILKEVAKVLPPEDMARRNKTFSTPLNQLAFNSLAMLYLHGRAQVIHDNLTKKAKTKNNNIEVEPEEKKQETKFILDFWSRLSPNYRNDGQLTAGDGTIRILSQDTIDTLQSEMVPAEDKPELVRDIKRATAALTSRNFLAMAECRAGIFEQGPYETASAEEVLIFKDFITLYTGEVPLGLANTGLDIDSVMPMVSQLTTKATSPVDNVIFGMTLKKMEKAAFNDWGTAFFEPADFTKNITSVGLWTRETIHPKDMRYPDHLGEIQKVSFDTLKPLQKYAQDALNEMYVEIATWDFLRKLIAGVNVYSNAVPAVMALYAGMEDQWDWTWTMDVINDVQRSDPVNTTAVKDYIKKLERYPHGVHPFLSRFFRAKKHRKGDPSYYFLQD